MMLHPMLASSGWSSMKTHTAVAPANVSRPTLHQACTRLTFCSSERPKTDTSDCVYAFAAVAGAKANLNV